MFSKFSKMKILNLLLVLMISVTVPLQAVSSTVFAATTTTSSSDTSTASDESIDEWMPDKVLQKLVYSALHDGGSSNDNHGGHETTSISQVTPAMMADIVYLNLAKDDTHVTGITDLTGLQYATGLTQFDFSGSTIEKAPGDGTKRDWSGFSKAVYSNLGTVDASSPDIDLKGLAALPPNSKKAAGGVSYTLENNDLTVAMPNLFSNGSSTGTQVTKPTNVTYDSNLSSMEAYIPLANWYKGFLKSDGSYEYGTNTTAKYSQDGTTVNGVTMDMLNHRFIIDLSLWGDKELKIPSFKIDDALPNDQLDDGGTDDDNDGNAHYRSDGNTLDAKIPMATTPNYISQTVKLSREGSIDTTKFGFNDTDSVDWTIKSGDLNSDDISFSPDLANNKIDFKLTDSGYNKLEAGDLKSEIGISAGGKLVDLTLSLEEQSTDWMPDANLREQLQADLTNDGLGDLTKTNLAKLTSAPNLSGVSDLTGLEYASSLTGIKMTDCDLNGDDLRKAANSKVLSKLTNLTGVEIDKSQLGGSLAGWGLDSRPNLTDIIAQNDNLTDMAGFTGDSGLKDLNLSNNLLSGTLPDLAEYTKLEKLYLNSNQFTGSVPTQWSTLPNLQILDLNTNKLSGTLDDVDFAGLTDVNLNYNSFTGSLPTAWFTSKLTSFQAINNQFSGVLPDLSHAVNLTKMEYGENHITSGTTKVGATGNYQTWSIDNPDWQTSSDGKTMTLDLSKYYSGESGQDYQYLGMDLASGQTGVTLDKTDPNHPLLTIDTTSTNLVNGKFNFNLFDQAGAQAAHNDTGGMNYLATVTVPVTLAIPKTYEIDTNNVDFGLHAVGSGITNAADYKLAVHSTNAVGDAYQLTAQTTGLTSGDGHEVPLYYYNGQHSTLLTNVAQSIYDYQPTLATDTTTVGDSSDSTKGNLRTEVGSTTYKGTYTGDVTYTLASAPADDPATSANDSDLTKISSLSKLSPTLSAAVLTPEQEATRLKLQTNMTNFVNKGLADSDGVLYSSYKAGQSGGSSEELTETSGLWLLALANSEDQDAETTFNKAFEGVVTRFYNKDTQTFNWKSEGSDHTITSGSASIDDLRIIQALLIMNQKHPDNERTAWLKQLINGFTKYDLNSYYQMIDGYNASGQEKRIRLDYLDLATLKAVYEAKGLYSTDNTAGETAYNQQLNLIKDSYISDQFPLFATFFDYSTGNYQVESDPEAGIDVDHINISDGLLTMLNLAKVGELPQTSLNWLKTHTANGTIYNNYKLDGTPVSKDDAASNYAYVAQIAAAVGDNELYSQALTKLKSMTSDDDNVNSKLDPTDPLYGSAQYGGESYAFNDLNMLLAYNSVIAGS